MAGVQPLSGDKRQEGRARWKDSKGSRGPQSVMRPSCSKDSRSPLGPGQGRNTHACILGGTPLPPDAVVQTCVQAPDPGHWSPGSDKEKHCWAAGEVAGRASAAPGTRPGDHAGTLSGLISLSGDGQVLSAKLPGLLRSVSGKGTFRT